MPLSHTMLRGAQPRLDAIHDDGRLETDMLHDPLREAHLSIGGKLARGMGDMLSGAAAKGWTQKIGVAGGLTKGAEALKSGSRDKAAAVLEELTLPQARRHHRDDLAAFCVKEHSMENLSYLEAEESGAADADLLDTYVRAGAPQEVNLAGYLRRRAGAGEITPRDKAIKREVMDNLKDTFFRFKRDPDVIRSMAEKLR